MTPLPRAPRGLIRMALVVAVAVAVIVTVVRFGHKPASTANAGPPAPSVEPEGIVCFGTVDLERGVASLSATQPGRVVEVLVKENQRVDAGAVLLRLEDGLALSRLDEAEAAVELAQLQLREAMDQPGIHRIRLAQQQATVDAAHSRVESARHAQQREERLAKSAIITDADRSIRLEKVHEVEAMERAEAKRLAELEAQDPAATIDRANLELKAAEARRDQARLALDECRIKAPRAGTVLRILVGPGDIAGNPPGQPAILFAADDPQVIRATVEQEFASRVQEGQPALIQDDADPNATWRGHVARLAGWYAQRRSILHDPSQFSDVRTLECLIVLEPGQSPLRLGQSVRVTIGPIPAKTEVRKNSKNPADAS